MCDCCLRHEPPDDVRRRCATQPCPNPWLCRRLGCQAQHHHLRHSYPGTSGAGVALHEHAATADETSGGVISGGLERAVGSPELFPPHVSLPNPDQVSHTCSRCGRQVMGRASIKCRFCGVRRCIPCHNLHTYYCPPSDSEDDTSPEHHVPVEHPHGAGSQMHSMPGSGPGTTSPARGVTPQVPPFLRLRCTPCGSS